MDVRRLIIHEKGGYNIRKRRVWGIPLTVLLLVLIVLLGGLYYIKPTKTLDLSYTDINWQAKLGDILKSRQPAIALSEEDINNLAKKEIAQQAGESKLLSGVQGASFSLDGPILIADMAGKWGPVRGEASAVFEMSFQNGKLLLTPRSVLIRNHSISPSWFGLEPIAVDPGRYLPDLVQIAGVTFEQKAIKVRLSLRL